METQGFTGFTPGALSFLQTLHENNDRAWFNANRKAYEADVKAPATLLAERLAQEVEALTGHPHNAKLFRIHRDTRFSKDKTPYNTHIRIALTPQGLGPLPGWFFGVGLAKLSLGTGLFAFSKEELAAFRARVASDGARVEEVLNAQIEKGARLDPPELKRVPHGLPKDHPQADLFRHKSLTAWRDYGNPMILSDPDLVSMCLRDFKSLSPVWQFCRSLT
ncbi:MAG: DUF2461 domain-containing protein [Pseudomonadota bacterium]